MGLLQCQEVAIKFIADTGIEEPPPPPPPAQRGFPGWRRIWAWILAKHAKNVCAPPKKKKKKLNRSRMRMQHPWSYRIKLAASHDDYHTKIDNRRQ